MGGLATKLMLSGTDTWLAARRKLRMPGALLDTGLELNTVSDTDRGQFEDRGYGTEVIYSRSDQDYDFRKDKTC